MLPDALTSIHGSSEMHQALEGEIGDMGWPPVPGLHVEVLLVAHPSAHLLPVALLVLVLHELG